MTVVTGGLGLIGTAITRSLLECGSEVIIIDTNKKAFESLPKSLKGKIHYENLDLTKLNEVREVIEYLWDEYGKIDNWINNAYARTKDWGNKLEDVSVESWRKNVDMQLNSYCIISNEVAGKMAKGNGGNIVNVSSIQALKAPDFSIYDDTEMTSPAAYTPIKAGILMYSKYLASYYRGSNLRINVVCPGGVFDNQSDRFVEKYSKKTLLGRMAKPEEIARPIVFLLTEAASYITGNALIVDGGWTAI